MFSDFIFEAASQIIQQAGKLHYMTNGASSVPLIVRAGYGLIKNAGPHHSGCYYPVWAHCPGLWVAVPSTPEDAKGLMKTALRSKNPVWRRLPTPYSRPRHVKKLSCSPMKIDIDSNSVSKDEF